MAIDLQPLYAQAFYHVEAVGNVTEALSQARDQYAPAADLSYEVIVPDLPDAQWLENVLKRVLYFCDSAGAQMPGCTNLFVPLFVGRHLYCVHGADLVGFCCHSLGISAEQAVESFGTHELDRGVREETEPTMPPSTRGEREAEPQAPKA